MTLRKCQGCSRHCKLPGFGGDVVPREAYHPRQETSLGRVLFREAFPQPRVCIAFALNTAK